VCQLVRGVRANSQRVAVAEVGDSSGTQGKGRPPLEAATKQRSEHRE
jgi:hypothetical protein